MAAEDTYDARGGAFGPITGPISNFAAITPHDSNELLYVTRGIYVGGAGDIRMTSQNGNDVVHYGAVAGSYLPVRVRIVHTDTTATNLVAWW